jgi:hypothetical protein
MYRVELQFDDISGNTQIDPSKIPHYPINDALASVAGRNLVGLPWDALAAKQAQGSQAMLRDQALRSISIAHGVPEVHLGGASPDLVAMHTPSSPQPPPSGPPPAPSTLAVVPKTADLQRSLISYVLRRQAQENAASQSIIQGHAMDTAMRENDQALQEDSVRRLVPTDSEFLARLARLKRPTIQELHTRVMPLPPPMSTIHLFHTPPKFSPHRHTWNMRGAQDHHSPLGAFLLS